MVCVPPGKMVHFFREEMDHFREEMDIFQLINAIKCFMDAMIALVISAISFETTGPTFINTAMGTSSIPQEEVFLGDGGFLLA